MLNIKLYRVLYLTKRLVFVLSKSIRKNAKIARNGRLEIQKIKIKSMQLEF
jgi:hypothetical protein